MASLRTSVSPNRRAAARLVGNTRRRLQKALAERKHVKRTQIADALGVHRSVITKQFNGTRDMSLGRAAELAWALGYEAEFVLHDLTEAQNANQAPEKCPAFDHVTVLPSSPSRKRYTTASEYEAV